MSERAWNGEEEGCASLDESQRMRRRVRQGTMGRWMPRSLPGGHPPALRAPTFAPPPGLLTIETGRIPLWAQPSVLHFLSNGEIPPPQTHTQNPLTIDPSQTTEIHFPHTFSGVSVVRVLNGPPAKLSARTGRASVRSCVVLEVDNAQLSLCRVDRLFSS